MDKVITKCTAPPLKRLYKNVAVIAVSAHCRRFSIIAWKHSAATTQNTSLAIRNGG